MTARYYRRPNKNRTMTITNSDADDTARTVAPAATRAATQAARRPESGSDDQQNGAKTHDGSRGFVRKGDRSGGPGAVRAGYRCLAITGRAVLLAPIGHYERLRCGATTEFDADSVLQFAPKVTRPPRQDRSVKDCTRACAHAGAPQTAVDGGGTNRAPDSVQSRRGVSRRLPHSTTHADRITISKTCRTAADIHFRPSFWLSAL